VNSILTIGSITIILLCVLIVVALLCYDGYKWIKAKRRRKKHEKSRKGVRSSNVW